MRKEHIEIMKAHPYPENLKLTLIDMGVNENELDLFFDDIEKCIPDHITTRSIKLTVETLKRQHITETAEANGISVSYLKQTISQVLYGMVKSIQFMETYRIYGSDLTIHNIDFDLYLDLTWHSDLRISKETTLKEVINLPLLGFREDAFSSRPQHEGPERFLIKPIPYTALKSYELQNKHKKLRYILGENHPLFERIHHVLQDRRELAAKRRGRERYE